MHASGTASTSACAGPEHALPTLGPSIATLTTDMYMTGDVDLPLDLIQAHAQGKLVLFVGAGASLNAPSNLPLFDRLAEEVGEAAHHIRAPHETVDHFLGRISNDVDVHGQVRRIITRPDSYPNRNHAALAQLVKSSSAPRVITTNFDEHLEAAAASARVELGTKYVAPALPVGRDFEGIAYIHGAVSAPPKNLILTDRDFGRAYLTDAWATRFLQQVFDNFVVLFVGYSHTDPIVSYLGLGLPSNARPRFVLTDDPNAERWDYLGIKPVGYSPERNHAALSEVLEAWAKRASMGQLEHLALVARIAQGAPPATPVERDYLIDAIQTTDEGASAFAKYASGSDWLAWAEELPAFKLLFTPNSDLMPGSFALARWFAEVFVAEPLQQAQALLTVSRLGLAMTDQLFSAVSASVNALAKIDTDAARRWLVLLATSIPGHSTPRSTFYTARAPETIADHLVLEQLVRPRITVQRNVMLEALGESSPAVRGELDWAVDRHTATVYWDTLRNSPGFDVATYLSTFERALSLCYELLNSFNGAGFDGLSFRRSAIEPHSQDQFPEMQDLIVDALRDCGVRQYSLEPSLAQRWLDRPYALFRRLAVHLTSTGPMPDSEKVEWVLQEKLLWDLDTQHERFMLLKAALPGTNESTRKRLIAAIVEMQNDGSRRDRLTEQPDRLVPATEGAAEEDLGDESRYETYNLLVWLADADPSWEEISDLRDTVAEGHQWAPREHPDLHSWMSSGSWQPQPPFTLEEFASYIATEGVDAALSRLLTFEYKRFMDGPEWGDALNLVRDVVSETPEIGLQIWTSDTLVGAASDKQSSIIEAILQAWASTTLEDSLLEKSLDLIEARVETPGSAWPIARFLAEQMRLSTDSVADGLRTEMRSIAERLWDSGASTFDVQDGTTPVGLSLNSWPGLIAQFWIFEISARWHTEKADWQGLDGSERDALDKIMSRKCDAASQASIPLLAREVVFLFNADSAYTTAAVIPLFAGDLVPLSWSWDPYLYHPSWNDGLLEHGMYENLLRVLGRLDELDAARGMRHQVISLLVNVAAFSSLSLERRLHLLDELVVQRPDLAVEVVREIIRMYQSAGSKDYTSFWTDWLARWMAQRVAGLPRIPTPAELSAWADLVPFLTDEAESALRLFNDQAVAFDQGLEFPDDFSTLRSVSQVYVSHLVRRMQLTDTKEFLTAYRVRELIQTLTKALGRDVVAPLIDEAGQRGITI